MDTFASLLNTGINAFNAYSGYQSSQASASLANQAFNVVAGSTAQQDAIANEQWQQYQQNQEPINTAQSNLEQSWLQNYTPDYMNQEWANTKAQSALQPQYIADQQQLLDQASMTPQDWGQKFATQAHTDTQNSFDQQEGQNERALAREGIDPTSGRSISALQSGRGVNQSLADVAGQQSAYNQGYDTSWNRLAGVEGFAQGNQIPQQADTSGSSSLVNQALSGLSSSNTAETSIMNSALKGSQLGSAASGSGISALQNTPNLLTGK